MSQLSNKNFVLRYKFSTCLDDNQHHLDLTEYNTTNTEDFVGLGIDV